MVFTVLNLVCCVAVPPLGLKFLIVSDHTISGFDEPSGPLRQQLRRRLYQPVSSPSHVRHLHTASMLKPVFPRITNILIGHFLLSLRQADRAAAGPSGSSPSAMSSLQVAAHLQAASLPAFIASMGEPVHAGLNTIEEAVVEEELHAGVLVSRQDSAGREEVFGDDSEAQQGGLTSASPPHQWGQA